MARVMTRCPNTGAEVSTILRMQEPAFEALTGEHAFRCGACGDIHRWDKADAWLEPKSEREIALQEARAGKAQSALDRAADASLSA